MEGQWLHIVVSEFSAQGLRIDLIWGLGFSFLFTDCWENSVPCVCVTEVPALLLAKGRRPLVLEPACSSCHTASPQPGSLLPRGPRRVSGFESLWLLWRVYPTGSCLPKIISCFPKAACLEPWLHLHILPATQKTERGAASSSYAHLAHTQGWGRFPEPENFEGWDVS